MRAALAIAALLASTAAHAEQPEGNTLSVQLKGAGYGVFVGGGLGLLAGYATGSDHEKGFTAGVGAAIGATIGIPVGVQMIADDAHGTGHGWGTFFGMLIGVSAAGAAVYGQRNAKDSPEMIISTLLIMAGCVTAGPIIGYRATEDRVSAPPAMLSFSF